MNFKDIKSNINQTKVLSILIEKRDNDEYWRTPNKGWMTSSSIKNEGNFERCATVTACLQSFRKRNIIECQSATSIDGKITKFFRITDEFYNSLKPAFHENFN